MIAPKARALVLALAGCAAALVGAPAFAKPADSFAAACVARGTREDACNCQAKLARQNLDARERQAAARGLAGGADAMKKEVVAMGEARARVFATKMQALGKRAAAECR